MSRIVVAGAGMVGSAVAMRLASAGRQVVLVDQRAVASGASGMAMGAVRQSLANEVEIAMARATINWLREHSQFQSVGYLALATTIESEIELSRRFSFLRRAGIRVERPRPDWVRSFLPSIGLDDVAAMLFTPEDGITDSTHATRTAAALAVEAGAELIEGTDVSELIENDDIIVIACGADSARVAARFNITVPLECVTLQLVETEPVVVPGDLPVIVDIGSGLHFRQRDGRLVAGGSLQGAPIHKEPSVDPRIVVSLTDALTRRLHIGVSVSRSWAGSIDRTPDGRALLGQIAERVYLACGFSGRGFLLSVGAAQLVAGEILGWGRVGPDYHAARFASKLAVPVDVK